MTLVIDMPPEGTLSPDGVAVVGKEGHLFLKEGNNNLLRQYSMPQDRVGPVAMSWQEIIADRHRAVSKLGISFMQVFIPEKSTVLRHLLPFSVPQVPTPVYQRLVRDLDSADYFFDTLPVFLNHDRPNDLFGKVDTHTTVEGARMLAATLADRIDPIVASAMRDVKLQYPNDQVGRYGDLGTKFDPRITAETQMDVSGNAIPGITESVKLIGQHTPDAGLTGSVLHWRRNTSQSPLRVMVFGNSFFERGAQSWRLSWWFKHFFREFIFCWNPALDLALVEKHQPDIVICQTVERFLTQVPKG